MHRVVVIDDNEPSLHMYSMVIERMLGGEVVAFTDPREALHYVSAMTPTLLVLDQNMPDMDGVQVVKALRNLPSTRSVPVIMLTGISDPDLKTRAIGAGVNAFLTKPIGAEEFAQYVKRLSAASRVRIPPQKDEETIELRVRADGADKRVRERDRLALWALFRAYEARDPEGAKKMRLAADIAVLLAIECRCAVSDVQLLRDAGFVYDIGKLSIPEKIFASPTALSTNGTTEKATPNAFRAMRSRKRRA
jgi:two-component system, response regulator RpfG